MRGNGTHRWLQLESTRKGCPISHLGRRSISRALTGHGLYIDQHSKLTCLLTSILSMLRLIKHKSRRIDAVWQRRTSSNGFKRPRKYAAQKPYSRPSCMLHDGKGSEILLALLPHCTPRKKVGEITTTQSSRHNFSRQEEGK